MKTILFSILAAILTGCAGLPGVVTTQKSKFDGKTDMESGGSFVKGGNFKLGLNWNESRPSELRMVAWISGYGSVKEGESLLLNFDGEVVKLRAAGASQFVTDAAIVSGGIYVPSSHWTVQSFETNRETIERILKSKKVGVRIYTGSGYIDGEISQRGPSTVMSNFEGFLKRLDNGPTVKAKPITSPRK